MNTNIQSEDIGVLEYIIENTEELEGAALGVAKLIMGQGNLNGLSNKQKSVFDAYISPLLKPQCDGLFGSGCSNFGGFIDKESVLLSYQEDRFLCQICRHDAMKIEEE